MKLPEGKAGYPVTFVFIFFSPCVFPSPQSPFLSFCSHASGPPVQRGKDSVMTYLHQLIDWLTRHWNAITLQRYQPAFYPWLSKRLIPQLGKLSFLCKLLRNCFWRVRLTEALWSFWNHSCPIQANVIYTWWCFELSKWMIYSWAPGKIPCTRYSWKMTS